MKKFNTITTVIAAALVAGSVSMTALAASNPADDVSAYSYNTGLKAYEAFKAMPAGEDLTDEELAAFFEKYGIGEGAAYKDGEYDESAKAFYGYMKGKSAFQERQASFQNWSAFGTLLRSF